MDFSKLSGNDKLALYGAIGSLVGGLLSFGSGWLTLLAALGMGFVVLQPQVAPTVNLPGSKGSLMLVAGGIAGVGALLGLLVVLPALGALAVYGGTVWLIGLLVGIAGGLLMGWAGWQAFQAEGGKFQLGGSGAAGGAAAAAPPPPPPPPVAPMAEPPASPPPPAPMSAPMSEPMSTPSSEPMGDEDDEDARS